MPEQYEAGWKLWGNKTANKTANKNISKITSPGKPNVYQGFSRAGDET